MSLTVWSNLHPERWRKVCLYYFHYPFPSVPGTTNGLVVLWIDLRGSVLDLLLVTYVGLN